MYLSKPADCPVASRRDKRFWGRVRYRRRRALSVTKGVTNRPGEGERKTWSTKAEGIPTRSIARDGERRTLGAAMAYTKKETVYWQRHEMIFASSNSAKILHQWVSFSVQKLSLNQYIGLCFFGVLLDACTPASNSALPSLF